MLVDSTMRRPECGENTRCCSAFDRRPNKGTTSTPRQCCFSMASMQSRMSRSEAKKHKMSPLPSPMSSLQASTTPSIMSVSISLTEPSFACTCSTSGR